jgi:hypothetical protein
MSAALILVFLFTLMIGVPVAFTMVIGGLAAVLVQGSLSPISAVQNMFAGIDSFPLLAIPFFILAAELMTGGALTEVLAALRQPAGGPCARRAGPHQRPHHDLLLPASAARRWPTAGPGNMLIHMMKKSGYTANTPRR